MLHLLVGHSILITSPTRVKRVSIADPAIAEAIVVTPYQVQLNGKAPGGVSLIIWDEAGQSQNFEVSVDIDILGITQKVHEVFPGEPVQIETSGNVVMLSGRVSSPDVADKILQVVQGVTPKGDESDGNSGASHGADLAASAIRRSQSRGDHPARLEYHSKFWQQHADVDQHAAIFSAGNRNDANGDQ